MKGDSFSDIIIGEPYYSINHNRSNEGREYGYHCPTREVLESKSMEVYCASNLQVYPNPVTKQCNIKYTLPQNTNVHISLFDATGRLVKDIINGRQNAGKYQRAIDMSNLAQSVYFIRIETDEHSQTEKIIYLK